MQNDGEFSEPFEVTNGVKQGYVMTSTPFSTIGSVMLLDALHDSDPGFPIRCRFEVKHDIQLAYKGCKPKLKCRLMC